MGCIDTADRRIIGWSMGEFSLYVNASKHSYMSVTNNANWRLN